jgi:hypothetical protein
MAKLGFLKRLIVEDFNKDDQRVAGKIAYVFNPSMEQLVQALTNGITFEDNIASQVKEITITVDAAGKPISNTSFKSTLKGQCKNIIVTRANNLTNSAVYVTSCPFISWTEDQGQIMIDHVAGLVAGNKFQLRLIATL